MKSRASSRRQIAERVAQETYFLQMFGEAAQWVGQELADRQEVTGELREHRVKRLTGRVEDRVSLCEVPLDIVKSTFEDSKFQGKVHYYRRYGKYGEIREIDRRAILRMLSVV
jgi:hypothetical protein